MADLVDIVILTAKNLERTAVLEVLADVEARMEDGLQFDTGQLGDYRVIVRCLHGMGNTRAAAAAAAAISRWNPTAIIVAGIAGGTNRPLTEHFPDRGHLLGDVLVARQLVDYESGKLEPGRTERRPQVYPASQQLLSAAERAAGSDWASPIRTHHPGGQGDVPKVRFGTVGSGEKVVKDPKFVDDLKEVWAQLVGVEMEGFGAALAAHESPHKVHVLLVKGISDWADPEKGDDWQPYAASAAAHFVAALLLTRPVEAKTVSTPGHCATAASSLTADRTGEFRVRFLQRLGGSWNLLAAHLNIPSHDAAVWRQGREAEGIWRWLEERGRLNQLRQALQAIGREDLGEVCPENPR